MDVTPPAQHLHQEHSSCIAKTNRSIIVDVRMDASRTKHTGDADVVSEDEAAGGGDEAGEEDEARHLPRVLLGLVGGEAAARHDRSLEATTKQDHPGSREKEKDRSGEEE
jgi:hypothetical protein